VYAHFDRRTSLRPTCARIDLGALRRNARLLARLAGPEVGVLAVIKADAYGHGAVDCALALEPTVWGFAVSLAEEGLELRRAGVVVPIVTLGSSHGCPVEAYLENRLTPVLSDLAELERFARAVRERGARLAIHLKLDTGMSRLGLAPGELTAALALLKRAPGLELQGLCTHLANADADDDGEARAQLAVFDRARLEAWSAGFWPQHLHAFNSAATARFVADEVTLVRPGLALFGYPPSPHVPILGLEPVMSLATRVVALRQVDDGTTISYGSYRAAGRRQIATLPIGYADGYTRRMTGHAQVLVRGRRAPVVGNVCMDMCMVDVTDVPGCAVGDEVVLLGRQGREHVGADELASWAGTVSWEVLCAVSKRVPRDYVDEDSGEVTVGRRRQASSGM
jgi:alanine racemase